MSGVRTAARLPNEKAPQVRDLEGGSGARGTRTPKPFRALAFEASALPFCQRSSDRESSRIQRLGVVKHGRIGGRDQSGACEVRGTV